MLPPALWALVAAISASRALLGLGPDAGVLFAASLALAAVIAVLLAVLSKTRARGFVSTIAVVGVTLSCTGVACSAELVSQRDLARLLSSSPVSVHEFTLEGDVREGASGWRARACVDSGRSAVWLVAPSALESGATLTCVGRFTENEGDEWGRASRMQGIAGTVYVTRVTSSAAPGGLSGLVLSLRSVFLARLDASASDARSLVAGTVCGYTGAMSERGLDDLFAACGVSHLVAVSGGHLVLVTSLVSLALRSCRLRPAARSATLLLSTAAFVAFCGAPVSAVRSWAMSLSAELARHAGRRTHPTSSAAVVGLVMALVDPGVTGQLGYLLSVVCVCGICVLAPYARYVLDVLLEPPAGVRLHACPAALRSLGSDAREALALTLVSQAVTAPLTCATFGTLSLVAPLANVLLAPLFSALLTLGLLSALLAWAPWACAALLACCEVVAAPLMAALRLLVDLPFACVAVSVDEGAALALLAAALALLLVVWPSVSRRVLAAALVALFAIGLAWHVRWRWFAPACVRVLDVGQGDAILVTDGAASLLVDTGPGDAVLGALARNHVSHLDAVVLTHLHADHAGGLEDLLAVVDVGMLMVPEETDAAELAGGLPVEEVCYGDTVRVGAFRLEAVSPVEPAGGEGNEGSLELLLTYAEDGRELTALLAADAERDETGAAVERGDVGDVDLLKVGHHGSEASLTPEIAAALRPEVSVASAGEGNRYGHPDPVCVATLEGAGSLFLCTMDVGDVSVEPGATGPVVSCQRRGPG